MQNINLYEVGLFLITRDSENPIHNTLNYNQLNILNSFNGK